MANQSIKEAFQRFWEYVTAKVDEQKTIVVNVTEDANGTFTADMTYEQIVESINAGKDCAATVKRYGDKTTYYLPLTHDYTGKYPVITFSASVESTYGAMFVSIHQGGDVVCEHELLYGSYAGGYYLRKIKFSETAETPTTEGDICFKLK